MKSIFLSSIIMIFLLQVGCTEHRVKSVSKSEDNWDENFNEELRGMTETGQTYHTSTTSGQADDGLMFFNQHKPQIKTVQLWLESGKVITDKIKEYLKSFMPDSDDTKTPAGQRILGRWYGLDRGHEEAVIFTFDANGRFSWQSEGKTTDGTYEIDNSDTPHHIIFLVSKSSAKDIKAFEFINDNALLLKGDDRDIILFKNSMQSGNKPESKNAGRQSPVKPQITQLTHPTMSDLSK